MQAPNIITEEAKRTIASPAQEPTHTPCGVAMINVKWPTNLRITADCATAVLCRKHFVILAKWQSKIVPSLIVLLSRWVREARAFNISSMAIWISSLPSDGSNAGAFFTDTSPPILFALVIVKRIKRFFRATSGAFLHGWIVRECDYPSNSKLYPCKPDIFSATYEAVQ